MVTTNLEYDAGEFWLISAYMSHDDEMEPPPLLLRKTLAEASRRKRRRKYNTKIQSEKVEGCHESSRFRHIFAKNPILVGYLKNKIGKWALSSEDTLKMLLKAHFPSKTSREAPFGVLQEDYAGEAARLDHLSEAQHTYCKVRPVDTALILSSHCLMKP